METMERPSSFAGSLRRHPVLSVFGGIVLLLMAVPSLLIGVGISLSGLSLAQRLLSFALRAGFLVCLVLSLARPLSEVPSMRTCHVALLDVSQSVSDLDLEQARSDLSRQF